MTPTPSELARKSHERNQKYLSDARTRGKEEGMKRREEIRAFLRDKRGEADETDPSTVNASPEIMGFGDAVSIRSLRARNAASKEKDS